MPTIQQPAADRSERNVLGWMCVLIAVNQFGFGAVIPVLPLYAQSFSVSQAATGATVAIYGLARVLLGIPAGAMADRLGRRSTLAIGGAVSAIGNLWCAAAESYVELVAARLVAGGGAGVVLTAGLIVLADITTTANRGRAMAIYQGVFLFAVGIGPFPGGYLAEQFGHEAPFLVYGVAGALAALVAWFRVPETRREAPAHTASKQPVVPLAAQLRALARHPGFLLVCGIGFGNALARTGALFSVVPILAEQRLALSATATGFGLALGSVLGLAVTYPGGALADRYGRKTVIVPATVLTGLSMLCFAIAPNYAVFLLACAIWGTASAAAGATPTAYAADAAPPGMNASAMGAYRVLSDAGYVLGPLLLGALADFGGLGVPFWAAAGVLCAAALLFAKLAPETVRR